MSDIVDRLRSSDVHVDDWMLTAEAADEIERVRAELAARNHANFAGAAKSLTPESGGDA
jgi:hypothetical protein